MQHIRQRLFARRAQHERHVRARGAEQLCDGVGERAIVAPGVEPPRADYSGVGQPAADPCPRPPLCCGTDDRAVCVAVLHQRPSSIANSAPRSVAKTDSSSSGHSMAASAARIVSTSSRS